MSDLKNQSGEKDAAVELLDEALTLAETIPNLGPRSGVLIEIAGRFYRYGQRIKAQAAATENLENISLQWPTPAPQAAALANFSPLYSTGGLELGGTETEILLSIIRRSQI